jgi:hypothetical protein
MGNEIFINQGIDISIMNAATKVPDIFTYFAQAGKDIPFVKDTTDDYKKQDAEFCKPALHPKNLPKRETKSLIGCGWYFNPDPSIPSVGAIGTSKGPLFKDDLPRNGRWMWVIRDAIEKEDIKFCKKIRSCDLMDVEGIRGVCGFCPNTGHAVPIRTNGTELYPNNPDGGCGVALALTSDICNQPISRPITTTEGQDCKQYGYPSADKRIRLYTRSDCDALGGNWSTDGECLKKYGGSYSWDCRDLNKPKQGSNYICEPDGKGYLTRPCLISLAKGLGFLPNGGILHILKRNTLPTPNEKESIRILTSIGIQITDAVLGNGNTDAITAGNVYKRIMEQTTKGNSEQIRNAAKSLTGHGDFNPCDLGLSQKGPFAAYCAQQAFRSAGCQPAGTQYPKKDVHTTESWGQLTNKYKSLYQSMNAEDGDVQESVLQCLGIKIAGKKGKCGK